MLKLALVKMQISLAMRMASWAMSLALIFVCLARARAAGDGVRPARADGANAVVRLDHVAIAGEQECAFGVGDDQQRVQMAQRAVRSPFLGQLDGARARLP